MLLGPGVPRRKCVFFLKRHEECVVLKPVGALAHEAAVCGRILAALGYKALVCCTEYCVTGVEYVSVVDLLAAHLRRAKLILGEKSLFAEYVKVDKIGVSRNRRGGLIRAVAK